MMIEQGAVPIRLPLSGLIARDPYRAAVSVAEAEAARCHAAAIGDYVLATRWLDYERGVVAGDDPPRPPGARARAGRAR